MSILKTMAYSAVAAVAAYNAYLAADVQQVNNDLTFDTIELTASGAEPGGDVGGGGGGGARLIGDPTPELIGPDKWDNDRGYVTPESNRGKPDSSTSSSSSSSYSSSRNSSNRTVTRSGVEVRISGRYGGIPGYNEGHWQVSGPTCASGHYDRETGHTYKSDVVSLLCSVYGNECDGWRYETAVRETIYWNEVIR